MQNATTIFGGRQSTYGDSTSSPLSHRHHMALAKVALAVHLRFVMNPPRPASALDIARVSHNRAIRISPASWRPAPPRVVPSKQGEAGRPDLRLAA